MRGVATTKLSIFSLRLSFLVLPCFVSSLPLSILSSPPFGTEVQKYGAASFWPYDGEEQHQCAMSTCIILRNRIGGVGRAALRNCKAASEVVRQQGPEKSSFFANLAQRTVFFCSDRRS
ncbi:hypothetical protein IWX90DRAFT_92100 [Phyllosticta citrichinensis]|uniref:Secreted protein n=1 Tax=Phyllosticta citrichinensis TaxID=1130410 RepID=A0ABR1XFC4_9PEZI